MYHSMMHATVSSAEMAGSEEEDQAYVHLGGIWMPNKGSNTVLATGNCIYMMSIYEVRCNNMV